jgi:uncharacterized protein YbaP (TraB family)
VPDESERLLGRLISGDATAVTEIRESVSATSSATLLVAAALVGDRSEEWLVRAAAAATTTRDRQLVAIASAHVHGDHHLVDALVRDHLVDHPDNVVAAWIALHHTRSSGTTPAHRQEPS